MQNRLTQRVKFNLTVWVHTVAFIVTNIKAFLTTCRVNGRDQAYERNPVYPRDERSGIDDWAEIRNCSESESGDFYVPAGCTSVINGDGYRITTENTSAYNKQINYSVRHEWDREAYSNPPHMYEEGETYE